MVSGSLLDLAQHLGCIRYHAWENMQNLVHYSKSRPSDERSRLRHLFVYFLLDFIGICRHFSLYWLFVYSFLFYSFFLTIHVCFLCLYPSLCFSLSTLRHPPLFPSFSFPPTLSFPRSSFSIHPSLPHSLSVNAPAPVTLDPNTADACLSVSDNLISVRYSEEEEEGRHLPDNRERFRYHECVLGSEAYSSGSHKCEVEVGENSCWALGVAQDNFPRKEWFPPDPEKGLWVVCFTGGQYRACSPTGTPLTLKKKTQRVRVHLDWERARLTFSDASDNSIIYSFKHRFTRRVFPYLSTSCRRHPLTISAGRVSVSAE